MKKSALYVQTEENSLVSNNDFRRDELIVINVKNDKRERKG